MVQEHRKLKKKINKNEERLNALSSAKQRFQPVCFIVVLSHVVLGGFFE